MTRRDDARPGELSQPLGATDDPALDPAAAAPARFPALPGIGADRAAGLIAGLQRGAGNAAVTRWLAILAQWAQGGLGTRRSKRQVNRQLRDREPRWPDAACHSGAHRRPNCVPIRRAGRRRGRGRLRWSSTGRRSPSRRCCPRRSRTMRILGSRSWAATASRASAAKHHRVATSRPVARPVRTPNRRRGVRQTKGLQEWAPHARNGRPSTTASDVLT